jgi:hypothetical protein
LTDDHFFDSGIDGPRSLVIDKFGVVFAENFQGLFAKQCGVGRIAVAKRARAAEARQHRRDNFNELGKFRCGQVGV